MLRMPRFAREVVEFCYPSRCPACEEGYGGEGFLCQKCMGELEGLEAGGACDRCGMPLSRDGAPCPYCLGKGLRPYERVLRLANFVDPIKVLVHHMKYHGRWGLAERFAERLLGQEDVKGLLTETDVLVPMPLYWMKQVARGYNQADVMARWLGRRCGIRVRRPVRRVVHTPTQTGMHSQAERWENVRGAFWLTRPGAVRGRHVVVVDDVLTTGATLRALGRELMKGRPASLSAIVVGVADPRGRGFEAI